MYQFKIKGIDYPDDKLQHGLGKGSGRGRPVGSKNGQVMPGAAYMKDYKIVGQKAVGEPATPGAARRASTGSNQNKSYGGSSNRSNASASAKPRYGSATVSAKSAPAQRTSSTASTTTAGTAASKVERGKSMVESLTGSNAPASAQQRSRDMSTKELRDMDPVGDWPWSNRRVQAAGGLEAREGRQIVYDNPTLSDDYKKQVAKRFGDSDGKSYPKYLDGTPRQQEKATTVQEESNAEQAPAQEESGNRPQIDDRVETAAQRIVGQRVDPSSQGANNTPNGIQAVGEPANVTGPRVETAANDIARRPSVPAGGTEVPQTQANNQPAAQTQPKTQTRTQETQEQKSFWDNLGGWLGQAGKDIGDTVTSGLNAASGAVSNAAGWVGDRLRDAGDWAVASTGDVGQWVGDRARDLGNWWNGSDTYQQVADPNNPGVTRDVQSRQQGAGEQIGNFVNNIGQGIGNAATNAWNGVSSAANNIGNGLNSWWNGSDTQQQVADPNNPGVTREVQARQPGAREQLGNFLTNVGQGVSDTWNGVAQGVNNAANTAGNMLDEAWNGREREIRRPGENGNVVRETIREGGIAPALANAWNDVTQGVGNAARAADTFINGPRQGTPEAAPYWDLVSGQYVDPMSQTFGDRVGQMLNNNIVIPAANAVNGANQYIRDNVVTPATNAANDALRSAGETIDNARQAGSDWWNGTDQRFLGIPIGHTPGARENLGNALNQAGQFVRDIPGNLQNAASAAGQWIGNTANNVGQSIRQAGDDAVQNARDASNVAGVAGRALATGVPLQTVNQWTQNYLNGQISPQDFEDLFDRWANNH